MVLGGRRSELMKAHCGKRSYEHMSEDDRFHGALTMTNNPKKCMCRGSVEISKGAKVQRGLS